MGLYEKVRVMIDERLAEHGLLKKGADTSPATDTSAMEQAAANADSTAADPPDQGEQEQEEQTRTRSAKDSAPRRTGRA